MIMFLIIQVIPAAQKSGAGLIGTVQSASSTPNLAWGSVQLLAAMLQYVYLQMLDSTNTCVLHNATR